jgi:hypothetical protein
MKLIMTLLVRDEADIIDAHLAFHLNLGVDFVIAIDHRSQDGTTDVLRSWEEAGYLRLVRREDVEVDQSAWVTSVARLAVTEYGADWVINSDADEFWWPRATSLPDALADVPREFGVVYAPMIYFPPQLGEAPFYEAMTVRLVQTAPINDPLSRYRPTVKAVHRGTPDVLVLGGNHDVRNAGRPLRDWYPLEVLHFPDRSPDQRARKYANTVASWPSHGGEPGAFVLSALDSIERFGGRESFLRLAVPNEPLSSTLGVGLDSDTRLRDCLRRLHSNGSFSKPQDRLPPFTVAPPTTADNVRHAIETAALGEANLIRVQRQVDNLGARLEALERTTGHAIRKLRPR